SFEAARRLYEPIVSADPGNAWAGGMLADLYLDHAEVLAPPADCRMYRLAHERYSGLQAAGRLIEHKEERAARAARAAADCDRTDRSP
ncbi:MAG TPA: hypothetical protein VKG23_09725, partial [Thermoanaerobaculia bacterium]|nr:hypothetical protein [Thermoanaerobaculia bacterium]